MKKVVLPLVALGLTLFFNLSAYATVLTFDELQNSGALPTDYSGLTWGAGWNHYDSYQPPYYPESSPQRIYNNDGTPSIAFSSPTIFNGAYFAGYNTASYSLYLNNALVYTSEQIELSDIPTWLDSGYNQNIDYVLLNVTRGHFVMDNFTYDESAPIPEPGTIALLSLGMAGLAVYGKRRNQKTQRSLHNI